MAPAWTSPARARRDGTAARLATARGALESATIALPRQSAIRVALARSSLDTAATALAVLGPSATLERGYAIVRREPDGLIVREMLSATSHDVIAAMEQLGE